VVGAWVRRERRGSGSTDEQERDHEIVSEDVRGLRRSRRAR
jgi:hypothetical protein